MFSVSSEFKVLWFIIIAIIFCLVWIFFSKNKDPISRKYRRVDFISWLIVFSWLLFLQLYLIYINNEPILRSTLEFIQIFLLMILSLFSGIWNLLYRKEINSDLSYRFWVSSFIGWWIFAFYLIAELLR